MLSRLETQVLRGIAITAIVLHNYCHLLPGTATENEFAFDAVKPRLLVDALQNADHTFLMQLLSFFGHYGVAVFFFLSGYGLVMKYERGPAGEELRPLPFLWKHFKKLFVLMAGILVPFIIYQLATRSMPLNGWSLMDVLAQLSMTVNALLVFPQFHIKPTPFWFFGCIMQLYVIYILVLHRWRRGSLLLAVVLLCWGIQVAAPSESALYYCKNNFVGNILPFALGIWLARAKGTAGLLTMMGKRGVMAVVLLLSVTVVFVGSFWFHSWLWLPVFVITGAIGVVKVLPSIIMKWCAWMGGISACLFVAHPLIRTLGYVYFTGSALALHLGVIVYLLASVGAAIIYRFIGKLSLRLGS